MWKVINSTLLRNLLKKQLQWISFNLSTMIRRIYQKIINLVVIFLFLTYNDMWAGELDAL